MDKMYRDGDYQLNNPTWHVEDSPWKARQVGNILQKNGIKFETLCEVGCGAGEILCQLQRIYPRPRYVGYEISPQAFALCKSRANKTLTFVFEDLLTQDNTYFDILLAMDVFEHVEDYLGFLKQLRTRAALKIFHIPLDLSLQSVLRKWPILHGRRRLGHLHYFFKDTALETLQDCGYSVLDYSYTAKRIEMPGLPLMAQVMKIPRKVLFSLHQDLAVRVLGGYSLLVLAR